MRKIVREGVVPGNPLREHTVAEVTQILKVLAPQQLSAPQPFHQLACGAKDTQVLRIGLTQITMAL
jgi:hypothetical protein